MVAAENHGQNKCIKIEPCLVNKYTLVNNTLNLKIRPNICKSVQRELLALYVNKSV